MNRSQMVAATPLPIVVGDFSLFGIVLTPPFGEVPITLPEPPVRDTDIYAEIVRLLAATGKFSRVAYPDPTEIDGKSADNKTLAIVLPGSGDESQGWDEAYEDRIVRKVSWTLEIAVRNSQPAARDELVVRLANLAHSTLDYQSLLGVTLPEWTKFKGDKTVPAKPPDRRIQLSGEFHYFVSGNLRSSLERI